MKKLFKSIALILPVAGVLFLTSCKKEETPSPEPENGTVAVKLNHVWGMSESNFTLNTEFVHPMNNDTMTFSTFKYYISNVALKKADGTWWNHPESYFLVDLSNPSTLTLDLGELPIGEYTHMQYVMGVDSTRNVSGAQTGALSTTNGMFWSWMTGYIMLKAEGTSPQSGSGSFSFHLGGFSGANNIVTTKNFAFGSNNLTVSSNKDSEVHIKVNPAKLFHADPLSSGTTVHMPGAKAKQMATNFYGGVVFTHIVD
jgi:hypothetical protein